MRNNLAVEQTDEATEAEEMAADPVQDEGASAPVAEIVSTNQHAVPQNASGGQQAAPPGQAASGQNQGQRPQLSEEEKKKRQVRYTISLGFVPMLHRLNVSVAVTSYQSGKFYLLGRNPKGGLISDQSARAGQQL